MAEEDEFFDSTIDDSTINQSAGGSAQPSFLEGVTNVLGLIAGVQAIGAATSALSDIITTPSAPQNFVVPDLANNGNNAFGFLAAGGGMFGTSSMVNRVPPHTDEALGGAGVTPGTWAAIDFMINKALGMDWQVRNADPGNPNILEAYRYAGRGFTQDGGTGQFSWAAAFATWVLVKAGFNGLRTMSSVPFERYGEVVNFHRGPLTNVRKWDIVVFTSNLNIRHVGFIKSYDPSRQIMEIVGGDQGDTVKITEMPFSVTNPQFRVTHVRRNWIVPDTEATSLRPTPPAPPQQTADPEPTEADLLGDDQAASDAAFAGGSQPTEDDLLGGDQAASDAAFGQGPSGEGASGFSEGDRAGAGPAQIDASLDVDNRTSAAVDRSFDRRFAGDATTVTTQSDRAKLNSSGGLVNPRPGPASVPITATPATTSDGKRIFLAPSPDVVRQLPVGNDFDNRTSASVDRALDRRFVGDASRQTTQSDRAKLNSSGGIPIRPGPAPKPIVPSTKPTVFPTATPDQIRLPATSNTLDFDNRTTTPKVAVDPQLKRSQTTNRIFPSAPGSDE